MTNARGNSIRIAIVGESNVGKTSILQRFCKGLYGQRIQTTVGIDKSEFSFSVGEDIVSTILLDMAGGNEFVPLVACFLRQVDAVVLVYDISDKESFITLPTWNSLIKSTNASDKLAKILVGNKKDLAKYQREVPFKAAKNFANFEGMVALEVSAKNDDNIDLLFHCIANEVKTLRSTVNDDRRKKAKEKSWSPLVRNLKSIFSRASNFKF
ncbi:ras-related protein Rab-33B-like [Rhopilema esculentum]|uniref:ras-related protein Rab-33B-like n=1 Tax=Rhopilema esculentum TaxID=499914 RepID=UPI0031E43B63